MKLSICIPQYNRINFLLENLRIIALQNVDNIEVVISDDCSTDDTFEQITKLKEVYKYPLIYSRNETNQGYGRNYRRCIELATGEYVLILGNDDTTNPKYDLSTLTSFLKDNNFPDIGFCNFLEESTGNTFVQRARKTGVLGTGPTTALQYYSCFSFVGGLVYKRSKFEQYNTNKHDGSIYAQVYLGCLMVASGCTLFSIHEPVVIKDIVLGEVVRNSYRDNIARSWKDYKKESGGLHSIINVQVEAMRDSGSVKPKMIYSIFRRIYSVTFPFWVIDYKSNNALPAAVGLIHGLNPFENIDFHSMTIFQRVRIYFYYLFFSTAGILTPTYVFFKMKNHLYSFVKSRNS